MLEGVGGHGAFEAVGELIERAVRAEVAECAVEDGEYDGPGHGTQGQATDDGSDLAGDVVQQDGQFAGVAFDDPALRVLFSKQGGEAGVGFDQHDFGFGHAFGEQRPRERAGAGAQFHDQAVAGRDACGHEGGQAWRGGRDGGNGERVAQEFFVEVDVLGDAHDASWAAAGWVNVCRGGWQGQGRRRHAWSDVIGAGSR